MPASELNSSNVLYSPTSGTDNSNLINKSVSKTHIRRTVGAIKTVQHPAAFSKTTFPSLIVCLHLLHSSGRPWGAWNQMSKGYCQYSRGGLVNIAGGSTVPIPVNLYHELIETWTCTNGDFCTLQRDCKRAKYASNRKSHTLLQLVPKLLTVNNPERLYQDKNGLRHGQQLYA